MRRDECKQCTRPQDSCFCHLIHKVKGHLPLLILQHSSEIGHPLGTAKIAKMSFIETILLKGEDFSQNKALTRFIKEKSPHLLFPDEGSKELTSLLKDKQSITGLIVLDGTWKKAKKIYYKNSQLHSLKKIIIHPEAPSFYKIRKGPKENYLSTLEAIVYSLSKIESKNYEQILRPMKFQIQYQIEKMGNETFYKNYSSRSED